MCHQSYFTKDVAYYLSFDEVKFRLTTKTCGYLNIKISCLVIIIVLTFKGHYKGLKLGNGIWFCPTPQFWRSTSLSGVHWGSAISHGADSRSCWQTIFSPLFDFTRRLPPLVGVTLDASEFDATAAVAIAVALVIETCAWMSHHLKELVFFTACPDAYVYLMTFLKFLIVLL